MVFEEKFFVETLTLGRKMSRNFPSQVQSGREVLALKIFHGFVFRSHFNCTLRKEKFPSRSSDINFYSFSQHPSELLVPSSSCKHFIASTYDIFIQKHFLYVSFFNSLRRKRLAIANMKTTGGRKIFASISRICNSWMIKHLRCIGIGNCNGKQGDEIELN